MRMIRLASAFVAAILAVTPLAAAQTAPNDIAAQHAYRPPLRGAPGGRVGGASRGTYRVAAPLPTIELLAPGDHTGLSANPTPTLYYFTSGPVAWPTRFTISAAGRPLPLLEATIPAPPAAGIYRIAVANYRVRLEPGVVYTWSVSAIIDPNNRARDIVASASVMLSAPGAAVGCASDAGEPAQRGAVCAQMGLWYDAVAAAVAAAPFDRHALLDRLLNEVGLNEVVAYARRGLSLSSR
jgi:hypothetical protein